MRIKIKLECNECKRRNYITTKNRRTTTGKVNLKKHCPSCRKHTLHKEKK